MQRTFLRFASNIPQLRFGKRAVRAVPHPEKAHRGGEDAFISDDFVIGVADGVGGYASSGVDPAIFTRKVMEGTWEYARVLDKADRTAQMSLDRGLRYTLSLNVDGGCPVTLMTLLSEKNTGSILNLGDCGTILFRSDNVLYKSTVQQHYFNCPYQLPGDKPSDGLQAAVVLQPGDVILQASDGVFDNVPESALLDALLAVSRGRTSTSDCATHIAQSAVKLGADETYQSPFSIAAKSAGKRYIGGKQDDVTVLITVVEETPKNWVSLTKGTKEDPILITELFSTQSSTNKRR